jgi:hypothetical protein
MSRQDDIEALLETNDEQFQEWAQDIDGGESGRSSLRLVPEC